MPSAADRYSGLDNRVMIRDNWTIVRCPFYTLRLFSAALTLACDKKQSRHVPTSVPLSYCPTHMPPEKGKSRGSSHQQVSARHLFSTVIEKREVDVSSLDEQQRVVFDKALAGQSLFVMGGAG